MISTQQRRYTPVQIQRLRAKGSVKFYGGHAFTQFCLQYFRNFYPERFEPVAIRAYYKKHLLLTLYAIDKPRWERYGKPLDWIPVKKFKAVVSSFPDLLPLFAEFNFTLATGQYPLRSIRVMNK